MEVMEQILRGWTSHSQGLELEAPQVRMQRDKREEEEEAGMEVMEVMVVLLEAEAEAGGMEPMEEKVETEALTITGAVAEEEDMEKLQHHPDKATLTDIMVRVMEAGQGVHHLTIKHR